MSLIVVGSVAYDGVETPHGKVDRMLGGAATYISLAASYFTKVGIVAVVGDDFAKEDTDLLTGHGVDLEGLLGIHRRSILPDHRALDANRGWFHVFLVRRYHSSEPDFV